MEQKLTEYSNALKNTYYLSAVLIKKFEKALSSTYDEMSKDIFDKPSLYTVKEEDYTYSVLDFSSCDDRNKKGVHYAFNTLRSYYKKLSQQEGGLFPLSLISNLEHALKVYEKEDVIKLFLFDDLKTPYTLNKEYAKEVLKRFNESL